MLIEVVKEIRFAVVMYGGVSLAIYINGVAQELLRMARVTAVKDNSTKFRLADAELDGIEKLYRDLSYLIADDALLGDADLLAAYGEWLKGGRQGESPLEKRLEKRREQGKPVKVARFIVDILSGSSAGGINGVYMAKAIVGGQSLKTLENLWVDEGDFAKLLCDERSISDILENEVKRMLGIENPETPPSLLNSERMYLKLLTAFAEMDKDEKLPPNPGGEALVDEVDLFVTMTDYWGIPVPIRLFDQLIYERRHRQNLHFRFRKDDNLNEFGKEMYPFLAFAARCTSSFPLAFDPMKLQNANRLIKTVTKNFRENKSDIALSDDEIKENTWKSFFRPSAVQDVHDHKFEIKWDERVFVDGGYLDNKPFGYAIEALAQKQSNVLVDRKLIYVEPEPELEDSHERATMTQPPSALENTLAALTDMPRYETIREDLQQVLQRNRLITRVNYLVANARRDELNSLELSLDLLGGIIAENKKLILKLVRKYLPGDENAAEKLDVPWERLELGEIAQQKGQVAYPYYRLRVAALTDDLSRAVTERAGYDRESDYALAVRDLVNVWRRRNYSRGEERGNGRRLRSNTAATPMLFLRNFDYNYRLRRLRFVLQQADRLLKFDGDLERELRKHAEVADALKNESELKNSFTAESRRILQMKFPLIENEIYDAEREAPAGIILSSEKESLRQTVRGFKKSVNKILLELRRDLRQVEPNAEVDENNSNKDLIEKLNEEVKATAKIISVEDLNFLLGKDKQVAGTRSSRENDPEARYSRALELMEDKTEIEARLNRIGQILEKIYNGDDEDFSVFGKSRLQIEELFSPAEADSAEQKAVLRRSGLKKNDSLFLAVQSYLRHFYDNFDGYDQIVFPVTYETPIGEAANIDVARVSPLDAVNLIDEKAENPMGEKTMKRRKVAGGVFFAFGAFFNKKWRKNDILWGRLDAVERFVSIIFNNDLIPEAGEHRSKELSSQFEKIRRAMIEEMQEEILRTGFVEDGKSFMVKDYENYRKKNPSGKEYAKMTDYVREQYRIDKKLAEDKVFETTARASSVLRNVLREKEFGKLHQAKNIALDGLGLTVKPKIGKKEWRDFLKPFLPSNLYILLGILILVLPLLILGAAVIFTAGQPVFWYLTAGLAVTLAVYVLTLWIIYGVIKNRWKRFRLFVNNLVYSKITGVERKQS